MLSGVSVLPLRDSQSSAPAPRQRTAPQRAGDVASRTLLFHVAPAGALYAFPGVDTNKLENFDDGEFALELLESESVLIVPGSSFNIDYRNHFRVTLLPEAGMIRDVFERIERALGRSAERQQRARQVA